MSSSKKLGRNPFERARSTAPTAAPVSPVGQDSPVGQNSSEGTTASPPAGWATVAFCTLEAEAFLLALKGRMLWRSIQKS